LSRQWETQQGAEKGCVAARINLIDNERDKTKDRLEAGRGGWS